MEMFQRPFQGVVDAYIEGGIDEKAFLKGTEYFKRWGFDYSLYRPILLFAKSRKIPVVALNQRREIVDKVFRGGLNSIRRKKKVAVPSGMDFSDEGYRKRLAKVFREHAGSRTENFDFFYQDQILWDETMSESITQFLKASSGLSDGCAGGKQTSRVRLRYSGEDGGADTPRLCGHSERRGPGEGSQELVSSRTPLPGRPLRGSWCCSRKGRKERR